MQLGNFIDAFLARHVPGAYAHHQEYWMLSCSIWPCTAPSAPYTRPTQRHSRPPPIQKLGAENHMLQLNLQYFWWWKYSPGTCRPKNTSIKLPSCVKLAFHFISWRRCTVKQPSSNIYQFHYQPVARCFHIYYTQLLHVLAIYPGHLLGVTSFGDDHMRCTRWTNGYDNWPKHVAVFYKKYENNLQLNFDEIYVKKEVKFS